jgi:hypothetical protein
MAICSGEKKSGSKTAFTFLRSKKHQRSPVHLCSIIEQQRRKRILIQTMANEVTASSGDARHFTFKQTVPELAQVRTPPWPLLSNSIQPGVWAVPQFTCKMIGGTGTLTSVTGENTLTRTSMILTFVGTRAATFNYIFNCGAP